MNNYIDNKKSKHKHLTQSQRVLIELGLTKGMTFRAIAADIGKDPSTISYEVKRFIQWNGSEHSTEPGIDCAHYHSCEISNLCSKECDGICKICAKKRCSNLCKQHEPEQCPSLAFPPYVCNGCNISQVCHHTRYYYRANEAHTRYLSVLKDSRMGIHMSPQQIRELDEFISPLIRNGQPLSHIFSSYGDALPCSRKTVYNYMDLGLFSVKNIDLPRRVRYKMQKKRRGQNPVNYQYRNRRSYKDFQKYLEAFPEYEVVEMDTVKGKRDAGKCLMTLLFRNSSFMLIFLLPSCTQDAVKSIFDQLYEGLGPIVFRKTFRVILTDNGPEFKNPWSIERAPNGERRTRVFYCDPYHSNQKGRLEKNHEFIRYIIPKGSSMFYLTPEDVRLMTCHINSIARDSLNGQTPFDLASLLISKKVPEFLGLHKISPDEVILKPALLKK